MFTLYQRFVLLPTSLVTWANLNHSLCGVENDPFYEHFNLGKWYWLYAEVYLSIVSFLFFFVNYLICRVVAVVARDE